MGKRTTATKRTLVRWNDDHDKELLLWIVYCCNNQGLKIPWESISIGMGPSFSDGACVQHIAKLRNKMEEAGLNVPPPGKRGTATRTASSIYRPKPKAINAQLPRIRPEIPLPTHSRGLFEDEEEEELEDDFFGGSSASKPRTARKTVRGPAASRKTSSVAIKEDSSEDDPLPPLWDSDNEHGAKKPGMPTKEESTNPSPPKTQIKLAFGEQSKLTFADRHQSGAMSAMGQPASSSTRPEHRSSGFQFDPLEDEMAKFPDTTVTAQPRGTRRKSSALAADEEDEDYVPDTVINTKGKSRSKKPRISRTTKKQKTDKQSGTSELQIDDTAATGKHETYAYDMDRAAMPPPALPALPATNTSFGRGWNTNFMHQPFASANHHNLHLNNLHLNDGAWNDLSPTVADFGFSTINNVEVGPATFKPWCSPTRPNGMTGSASTPSDSNSRHHSFASATSSSTVESQPASWNQPIRSPGFPNPNEASMVLHALDESSNADASTQIDIFSPPIHGRAFMPLGNHAMSAYKSVRHNGASENGVSELFIGTPEDPDIALEFSEFLNYDGAAGDAGYDNDGY